MLFRKLKLNSRLIRNILLTVLPGILLTGGLLYANSNVYYDIDTQKTMVNTTGGFNVSYTTSLATTTITGSTTLTGNLVPSDTNTYNLGSSAESWNNLYVNNLYATSTTIGGNQTITGDLTVEGTSDLATTTITGDFTVNTNDLYVDTATGYVGISTTSPSQLLTVGDDNQFTVSSAGAIIGLSYGGILQANLVDKTASETITGTWDFSTTTHTNATITYADVNSGTVDAITSLTVADNVDIGNYNIRSLSGTFDSLTSGRVIFAGTAGLLSDDSDITFSGETLTVTQISVATTTITGQLTVPTIITSSGDLTLTPNVNLDLSSGDLEIGGTSVLSSARQLQNIASLDDTTESTIETAIDTLSNLTSIGTIGTGVWQGTEVGTQWGGTGQNWVATATGSIPYFSSLGTMTTLGIGSNNYVLTSNGTTPSWGTIGASSVTADSLDWSEFTDTMTLDATTTIAMGYPIDFDSGTLYISPSGNVGIGTTSPQAQLDIFGTGNDLRLSYDATNYVEMSVDGSGDLAIMQGNVGIGETAPGSKLSVSGGATIGASYDTTASPSNGLIIEGNVGIGTTSPNSKLDVWGNLNVGTSSTPAFYVDSATGNVGIGTGVPTSTLEIYDSSSAQLTLTQTDGTNYAQFKVDSVGDLRITAEGGDDIKMANDNLWICSGGSIGTLSCPTLSLSTNGNLVVENDIYIDDSGTNHSEYKKICPDGYIWVSGNSKFGTESGFCVMKYEAKCDDDSDGVGDTTAESADYGVWVNSSTACTGAGKDVVSSAQGAPITYISQVDAQAYCEAIGEGYHLITDQEWMTIAEDAGWQDENWCDLDGSNCGNTPGTNYLAAGHNDNAPSEAEDATTSDSYPCYATVAEDTNATCGDSGSQKRTHTLSNGEVIWDVAGNVYEWTDNYIVHEIGTAHTDGEMPLNDTAATTSNWYEYTNVVNYKSINYIKPFRSDWSSTQRIGKIYLDYNGAYTTGDNQSDYHAFKRGGSWSNTSYAGVWTLSLDISPAHVYNNLGFRCAR